MKRFITSISLVALMICALVVPAAAASYPPALDMTGQLIYSTYDGTYRCARFMTEFSFTWNGHQVVAKPNTAQGMYEYYNWNESKSQWVRDGYDKTIPSNATCNAVDIGWTVYASSDDIYDTSGELFFPLPPSLSEAVQILTEEQGAVTLARALGVMKILVPCGVGCLALLTAFPVLRKGLLRFLH